MNRSARKPTPRTTPGSVPGNSENHRWPLARQAYRRPAAPGRSSVTRSGARDALQLAAGADRRRPLSRPVRRQRRVGLRSAVTWRARAVLVDREPRSPVTSTTRCDELDAGISGKVHVADALRYLQGVPEPFDVVFLDPPFASGVLAKVCERLANGWLRPARSSILESPADAGLPALPPNWVAARSKRAGQVGYHLLRT